MTELRRAPRRSAAQSIPVTDTMTGEVIGRIGNLSSNGMMLICSRPMTDDALYQFAFDLGGNGTATQPVVVGAHQQWCEESRIAGQYWAGFRIIDLGGEDDARIRAWIRSGARDA